MSPDADFLSAVSFAVTEASWNRLPLDKRVGGLFFAPGPVFFTALVALAPESLLKVLVLEVGRLPIEVDILELTASLATLVPEGRGEAPPLLPALPARLVDSR